MNQFYVIIFVLLVFSITPMCSIFSIPFNTKTMVHRTQIYIPVLPSALCRTVMKVSSAIVRPKFMRMFRKTNRSEWVLHTVKTVLKISDE